MEAAPRYRPIKPAPPEALGKALKTSTREGENRLASEPAGGRTPRRPTSDPRDPRPTAVRRIGRRCPQPQGSPSSDKTTDHHDHPRARRKSPGPLLDFGRPTLFRVLKQLARAHLAAPAPARPRPAGPAPLASPAHLTGRHDTACQAACSSAGQQLLHSSPPDGHGAAPRSKLAKPRTAAFFRHALFHHIKCSRKQTLAT